MLERFNPLGCTTQVRLSEATRDLARHYLSGLVGDAMQEAPAAAPGDSQTVQLERLMRQAEIALDPAERLVGAARFKEAAQHLFPGTDLPSISHVTVDFQHAVGAGLCGLEADLAAGEKQNPGSAEFYRDLRACIAAMRLWVGRCREEVENRANESPHFPRIAEALKNIPDNPPRDFFEAVQSLWLFWTFLRISGHWSGLGRMDELLGSYLERDLAAGRLTLDEAREILACFWIKGTEWIMSPAERPGGDAQFYQNVILGGIDRSGREVCNPVSMLILDIVEELHISDFPIGLRLNRNSPAELIRRAAEVQRLGGGIVSAYNEEVAIAGLVRFGFPEEEARSFTNDGCWEILIPGETAFSYMALDILERFQKIFFSDRDFPDFETLFSAFADDLHTLLSEIVPPCSRFKAPEEKYPSLPISLLMPSCVRTGRPYNNRGAKYNVLALHAGGLPDVADSLGAIRKLVYEEKRFSLDELRALLLQDFVDNEALRLELRQLCPYYGNDDGRADELLLRVANAFADAAETLGETGGLLHPAGISTFGREVGFAPNRLATPFGAKAHEYLASNLTPSPGNDRSGSGAILKSYCKVDFTRFPSGAPLDLRFDAAALAGPSGVTMLEGILKSFITLGGSYLQIDAVSHEMLLDAQKHPERYPNLAVRISGWSARFATLDKAWQDMIIHRSVHRN